MIYSMGIVTDDTEDKRNGRVEYQVCQRTACRSVYSVGRFCCERIL